MFSVQLCITNVDGKVVEHNFSSVVSNFPLIFYSSHFSFFFWFFFLNDYFIFIFAYKKKKVQHLCWNCWKYSQCLPRFSIIFIITWCQTKNCILTYLKHRFARNDDTYFQELLCSQHIIINNQSLSLIPCTYHGLMTLNSLKEVVYMEGKLSYTL